MLELFFHFICLYLIQVVESGEACLRVTQSAINKLLFRHGVEQEALLDHLDFFDVCSRPSAADWSRRANSSSI